ncbi:MAG: GatB/YqeY domain-containing protein [Aestuariibacter sp.]
MSLKEQLTSAQKDAMRARDKIRLGTIRMALAEVKQREIDGQTELQEADVLAILTKMVKQRNDDKQQFESAGRDDLASQEQQEIEVLHSFLPQPLSEDELSSLIADAMTATSAQGMQDMGKVMGWLKPKVQGKADMGAVSKLIKDKLSS